MTPGTPQPGPAPETGTMTVAELDALARARGPWRGKAVFALIDRIPADSDAVESLGDLARQPIVRANRMHLVTLAWAVIQALLAAGTPRSRELAERAFAELSPAEQQDFLRYLKAPSIQAANPPKP
ncbi:MAG: hypothetical protein HOV78_14190 [Hamadaea sp.]|nr:hypothetical protein [Hamadaea sp.]